MFLTWLQTSPTQKFQSPLSPILNWPPNDIMTDLVGVLQDSVALHHNSESSTLCQIRPWRGWQLSTVPVSPLTSSPCRYRKLRFFLLFLHQQPLIVFSVKKKKIINSVNSDRAVSPPRRPATLRLLPCVSTSLPQSVTSLELKFFISLWFAFVENCRVSPLERDLDRGSA